MVVSFRLTLTMIVIATIAALALLLTVLQYRIVSLAAQSSANESMETISKRVRHDLDSRLSDTIRMVDFLTSMPVLAGSNERRLDDRALDVFEALLTQINGADSVYVGYDNGEWLQLLRASGLTPEQREKLAIPAKAAFVVNLVHAEPVDEDTEKLPLRRRFLNDSFRMIGQIGIDDFGYDARERPWFIAASGSDETVISQPYLSFSSGAPMITVSAQLRGPIRGVVATDIRMDEFSAFVAAQNTVADSIAVVATKEGVLLAHPDYNELLDAKTGSGKNRQLPDLTDIAEGPIAQVLREAAAGNEAGQLERGADGKTYLYRVEDLNIDSIDGARVYMIANADNFAGDIRELQRLGLLLALGIGAFFIPIAWFAGGHVSGQLRRITEQAVQLSDMQPPTGNPVNSAITEIRNLGSAVDLAQKAIWSFSRFVPMELVRGLLSNRLSTEIGGVRREITVVFTDVENFTTIAENTDPNVLMNQTSRYFAALSGAFLEGKGTIDKFIGDAVMVFWNAPKRQANHVERACRAVLAARAASEAINDEFEKEGLQRFRTRFGIHVGEAVVGNLGSDERMNYTAIGNTVNLAARLEGLNKNYDTQILASNAVRSAVAKKFVFRKVDRTRAKGMTRATTFYELIGPAEKK